MGHLWSIDCPPLLTPGLQAQVGAAVVPGLRHRWSYVRGTSRQRLRKLLDQIGEIGLFVHDSRHTEANVRFELDTAWDSLRSDGVVVVDDIDTNWGFRSFSQKIAGYQVLNCHAEPFRPDVERFEGTGLFGIARKTRLVEHARAAELRTVS